ncbi:MAG: RNA-binding protein [Patescibacteria group bacterium]
MQNKLFVGSLPWATDDAELTALFSPFGEVTSARVMTDKFTGRSRGFGFVEFANEADAAKAVAALDGSTLGGRQIVVNVARPPKERE